MGNIWSRHVERFGGLKDVRTLGAASLAPGRVRVLMELKHERGAPCLEIVPPRGRLNIFRLDAGRAGVGPVYNPSGRPSSRGSRGSAQPPAIRFEDGALVVGALRARRVDGR